MIKAIIFDFDGVIVESLEVKTDAFVELYSPYGKNITRKVVKYHQDNGGVSRFEKIRYFHKEFLNITLNQQDINVLANKFSNLVKARVINVPYVSGVIDFIKQNVEIYNLFISTATPYDEIKYIIRKRGLDSYFIDVFGSPDLKINHIKQIIFKHNLKPNEIMFFGDSETDLYAAEKVGTHFILIKNDFNKHISKNYNGEMISTFKHYSIVAE
jgi:Predicted phosphatases